MKRLPKISIGILLGLILVYLSIDVQKLDHYKAKNQPKAFNAEHYAAKVWKEEIPEILANAPDITELIRNLESRKEHTLTKYGHKLGISKTCYFTVKGNARVVSIDEENLQLQLEDGRKVLLATSFIFGNAIRDGLGVVSVDDFLNMTDFNNVSIALNNRVKTQVIPDIKKSVKVGDQVVFAGALALNETTPDLQNIRLIPLTLSVTHGKQ